MKNETNKKVIKFEEIRERVISSLKNRTEKIRISEPVTLMEGFVNEPFGKELSSSFVIGGPTVPMVMLVGNESGLVYLFALKAILPEIELW